MKIRTSDPVRDGEAVAAIYRPAVEGSPVSFEEEVPSPEEMQRRIRATLERTPWLLAEVGGEVIGYAYAYAGVALPNPASVGLHEAIGMKPIGVYRAVGYKLGNWWDVMWLGMRLGQPSGQVIEPLPLLDRD